jgi:hypothetical protein
MGFVVNKVTLGQDFSEYFGFLCQSFRQFLHHHNHPGMAQQAYWWPQCRVDPIGLHPHYTILKKLKLVADFRPRRPEFTSRQSMWGLWWTERHWGRFSPSTSVSLANHLSTNFSTIIITRG